MRHLQLGRHHFFLSIASPQEGFWTHDERREEGPDDCIRDHVSLYSSKRAQGNAWGLILGPFHFLYARKEVAQEI